MVYGWYTRIYRDIQGYTGGIWVVYAWYTGGIRVVYGGYTGIYGDIRGYTQYIVSIAYIGYTGIYGWYTVGIRVVYDASSKITFSYICMFNPWFVGEVRYETDLNENTFC